MSMLRITQISILKRTDYFHFEVTASSLESTSPIQVSMLWGAGSLFIWFGFCFCLFSLGHFMLVNL